MVAKPVNALDAQLRKAFPTGKMHKFALQVEFQAPAGVTVIFGPSGAGKTTILECIAGLTVPDSGRLSISSDTGLANLTLFDSAHRLNLAPQQRRIGYVFQDLALFPHMSAADNIGLGVRSNGAQKQALVRDMLERFRIGHVASHKPGEISGGERQRVALARALVIEPRVLLLDEPFSALDDALKLEIIADLKLWLNRSNIPVLFVTHDRSEAAALGDRMLLLHEGRIIGQETITRSTRN